MCILLLMSQCCICFDSSNAVLSLYMCTYADKLFFCRTINKICSCIYLATEIENIYVALILVHIAVGRLHTSVCCSCWQCEIAVTWPQMQQKNLSEGSYQCQSWPCMLCQCATFSTVVSITEEFPKTFLFKVNPFRNSNDVLTEGGK